MPAGGLSNLAFNLAEDVPCLRRALPSGPPPSQTDVRQTKKDDERRRYTCTTSYFDWDRFDAGQAGRQGRGGGAGWRAGAAGGEQGGEE